MRRAKNLKNQISIITEIPISVKLKQSSFLVHFIGAYFSSNSISYSFHFFAAKYLHEKDIYSHFRDNGLNVSMQKN